MFCVTKSVSLWQLKQCFRLQFFIQRHQGFPTKQDIFITAYNYNWTLDTCTALFRTERLKWENNDDVALQRSEQCSDWLLLARENSKLCNSQSHTIRTVEVRRQYGILGSSLPRLPSREIDFIQAFSFCYVKLLLCFQGNEVRSLRATRLSRWTMLTCFGNRNLLWILQL